MKTVKAFTIDRKRWANAETHRRLKAVGRDREARSYLLDEHGRMCCLGFYAQACGVAKDDLLDVETPVGLAPTCKLKNLLTKSGTANSYLASDLMDTNDDAREELTIEDREARIRALFKQIRVQVKFKGEYPRLRKRSTR